MSLRSWLQANKAFTELLQSSSQAREEIVDAFIQSKVDVPGTTMVAWGQYLDRPHSNQYGLYGTAAGSGTLIHSTQYAAIRMRAVEYLIHRYESVAQSDVDRYQFLLVPKIAGFLRALSPSDITLPRVSAACQEIIVSLNTNQVDKSGWGYFLGSTSAESTPTAMLLLAMDELGLSNQLVNRRDAVSWLLTVTQSSHRTMHPGELALSLHAIRNYGRNYPELGFDSAVRAPHRWFLRQLRISPISWYDYLVSYTTVTATAGVSRENDEYFVMPSALMELRYLIAHRRFDLVRPIVLHHARGVVSNVTSNDMYTQSINHRAASRENQWAFDFCRELQITIADSRKTFVLYSYFAGIMVLFSRRSMVLAVLLGVALVPALYQDPHLIVPGFVASIVASLVAEGITRDS